MNNFDDLYCYDCKGKHKVREWKDQGIRINICNKCYQHRKRYEKLIGKKLPTWKELKIPIEFIIRDSRDTLDDINPLSVVITTNEKYNTTDKGLTNGKIYRKTVDYIFRINKKEEIAA